MKKWLIPLIVLTISLAVGGIATGFTLSGGSGTPAQGLAEQVEEPTVCNAVHNINACTQEELYELGLVGPATMKGPFPFVAPITGGDGQVVTSIDDIDPTVCNAVHNINACTQEELYELGLVPVEPIAAPDQPADLTHGSPQPSLGSPVPSLTFDGVDYIHSGYAELPSGEGTVFIIDGIEINLADLEMVGTTHEGNTAGIQDGLMVYRLKTAGTNEVYTFRQGEDIVNLEDGRVFKGRDAWTGWTAK